MQPLTSEETMQSGGEVDEWIGLGLTKWNVRRQRTESIRGRVNQFQRDTHKGPERPLAVAGQYGPAESIVVLQQKRHGDEEPQQIL